MIDRSFIGKEIAGHTVAVEKGQLRAFAIATDEKTLMYFDEKAALAAGHRALPAPPTFAFTLNIMKPDQFGLLREMGVDMGDVLHGEQHFEYFKPIYAGDVLTMTSRVEDIYSKKNGALEFIEQATRVENQCGELLVRMRSTTVVRRSL